MTYQLIQSRHSAPSLPRSLSAALAALRSLLAKVAHRLTLPTQVFDDPDFGRFRGWPESEVQLRRWPY
ncbi:MAG TPA: hypothetical protein PLL50_01560 [Propionicimonas sp.]|nr:hypothetical protein [Propionicimonas sp.]HQA77025.1 hypothetical protein [Propionicimonas sp.]HQD96139.1 hypothetical protein [Propionicimonas sp.]